MLLDIEGRQGSLRQNIDLKINKAKNKQTKKKKHLIPIYCYGERERKRLCKQKRCKVVPKLFIYTRGVHLLASPGHTGRTVVGHT